MTTATARRETYNAYCEDMIARFGAYAPTKITDWKEMQAIQAQICPRVFGTGAPRIKRQINCMAHGQLFDNCGVYQLRDGRIVEYVEYTENRGGLSTVKIFEYASIEAHDAYKAPLPEWIWHNH